MSGLPQREFDTRLLELHLGHLSADEQAALRRQIAGDPPLASQDEALAAVFAALDSLRRDAAPVDLALRVMSRVRAAGPPPQVVHQRSPWSDAAERTSQRVIRLGNLRDIVAVAALLVLAVGIGVPSVLHTRERQQRLGCSQNLWQLGMGVQRYSNVFSASLPFAGWTQGNSWQATTDPQTVTVPNRRHMYPLLLLAYVTEPRLFVCPSQPHVPMSKQEIQRHNDFLEARNVSYAYQNMAGVRPAASSDPRLPILADDNPLFEDGRPLLDPRRYGFGDPTTANSYAHRRAGQNILTLDGHVKWNTTPLCGIGNDNIWTLQHVGDYTGREGPATATDSHLLK